MEILQKNEIYELPIDGFTSEALGVCHVKGRAVFVAGALPGELWRVRIVKVTATAVYGRGEECLKRSPSRQEPDCPHFGKCGGCDTRHMSYDAELRFKLDRVNDALTRIGHQSVTAQTILGSDEVLRYRNKGIFELSGGSEPVCGFYRERSHELIEVEHCLLQNELTERAAQTLIRFMRENGLPAYDEATGKGTVRHVYCRRAVHTGDAVLCIIAARGFGARTGALVAALRESCPELTGIVLNVNKTRGNTVLTGDFYTLWGRETMTDTLCALRFEISPQAFYQINPPQAEKLYNKAVEYASELKPKLAFDLYCGAGTISLCLARCAEQVSGCEIVPEAVENARKNADANGVTNARFLCADAGKAAQTLSDEGLRPDVVVVDPPRKGMDEQAVAAVASMQPRGIVYVSCNPATLARDVLRFTDLGYTLRHATAVDMFPRTSHVETVVLMSRDKE